MVYCNKCGSPRGTPERPCITCKARDAGFRRGAWRPVETPPDPNKPVLVLTDDGHYWLGFFDPRSGPHGRWKSDETHGYLLGVTDWHPLPEKPR